VDAVTAALNGAPATTTFIALECGSAIRTTDTAKFLQDPSIRLARVLVRAFDHSDAAVLRQWADLARGHASTLVCAVAPEDITALSEAIRMEDDEHLIFTLRVEAPLAAPAHAIGRYRLLADRLRSVGCRAPIWIRNTAVTTLRGDSSFLSRLLDASILTGALLCDGLGDIVSIETESDPARATKLAYNVLQGAGARISKTEFVACPSCGRTLFDLQTTTQRIREKTGHLKGVKLAIMGCIVNGPGEMADADFGYVGGAPGKINLYVGKTCVQYNIPQAEADDRLIALIKAHGKWADPAPLPV
jgi:(E)-4-hydroxy-3-methylbut-2-enyl-diphosphate synthase